MEKISITVVSVIILLEFFIALLINYASSSVPDFVKKHPDRLWLIILISIIILIILVIWQKRMATSYAYKPRKPSQTANLQTATMPQTQKC